MEVLNYLDFRCSWIGPLGAVNLSVNMFYFTSGLKNLNISFNKIGPKAIRCIAFSLRFLNNLCVFDVSSNMLEDEGAGHLSKHIKHLTMLSYFDVSNNDFTDEGKKLISTNQPDSSCYLQIAY